MQTKLKILASLVVLLLAACASDEPRAQIAQSREIDTDIDATHVVGPPPTNDASPSAAPWRGEEDVDHLRALRQQLSQ